LGRLGLGGLRVLLLLGRKLMLGIGGCMLGRRGGRLGCRAGFLDERRGF